MTQSSVLLIGLSIAAAMLLMLTAAAGYEMSLREHSPVAWIMIAEALIYGVAAALLLRCERAMSGLTAHRCVFAILAVAAALRVMLIFQMPISTDIYRYVWDGRVQAAGINPYRYAPADPHLSVLRDARIYPEINRAEVATTIYPPMAQVIFFGATRLAEDVSVMKTVMVGFECIGITALLALLARRGLPQTRILLYAWHPLPLFEFAGSGHIDAAAIGLMLLACLMADRRRPFLAGALLAGATLVKFFPAVLAPALYRRWDWRLPAAAVVTCVLLYLPYIGVGRQVLGFLPGYLEEEGLTAEGGFFALTILQGIVSLPRAAPLVYVAIAVIILMSMAFYAIFRLRPEQIAIGVAAILITTFTAFLSPHFPWYFTWIVPFLCFMPSAALIYLTTSASLLHGLVWTTDRLPLNVAIYAPFVLLLVIEIVARPSARGLYFLNEGARLEHSRAA
jgi:hypothetical protein